MCVYHANTEEGRSIDPAEVRSSQNRPISNLSVFSKLLGRLVGSQLLQYFKDNGLLPHLPSAYRAHHSTETALVKVLSDILLALDSGSLAMLTLLDLSAAFVSVDHETLLRRLQTSYGLGGTVLDWFRSYLSGRVQHIHSTIEPCSVLHHPSYCIRSIPQG